MAVTTTEIDATPEAVFDVLDDPYAYPDWVVGAKQIRAVDPDWPAEGSSFHHTVGVGPFSLDDHTSVIERRRPTKLVLRARARPTGVARVVIELSDRGGKTHVRMEEAPIEGLPAKLHNPLQDKLIHGRNVETLRRLKNLAEGRRPPSR